MKIVVQKFGGSSVADLDKLHRVCNHIIMEKNKGNEVVVVVSAQGDTTDLLLEQEKEITKKANKKHHDLLVSVGEQITVAKLAMCLEELGFNTTTFLGWQVPIITNSNYGDASIINIKTKNIKKELNKGNIVIVAGFQGVDKNNNITTLGRGGSDTTAVYLSCALNAKCELYKDVDGIYNGDPNKDKNVKKYKQLSYDQMQELVKNGAQVLHDKCITMAKKNSIQITVKSTFKKNSLGTIIHC